MNVSSRFIGRLLRSSVQAVQPAVGTVTILALMCLISHSLAIETAVQKKTGTSFSLILVVRLCVSFAGVFTLNLLLPPDSLLEDPLLFVAIGASIGWVIIPRVILAGIVVWIKRGIDRLRWRDRGAVVP